MLRIPPIVASIIFACVSLVSAEFDEFYFPSNATNYFRASIRLVLHDQSRRSASHSNPYNLLTHLRIRILPLISVGLNDLHYRHTNRRYLER
ncbi:hypothetical protein N0V94_000532 [Neodidymelliopsis sp. IMI 364377]|nr:hypothetical protein N0V94_000532 [Neodidymelliopsis sp. IMI 364377]